MISHPIAHAGVRQREYVAQKGAVSLRTLLSIIVWAPMIVGTYRAIPKRGMLR